MYTAPSLSFYDLFKYHAEKDDEQSQCQNTILFHAVDDGEGSREVAVQPNLTVLVFVELDNHAEKLCGATKALSFCSLCQTLWSGPQTLHTALCFAPCISLGAVCSASCWLWNHTWFLVDGLQRCWVLICLGIHEPGFFLRWRAEWSPDSWSNLTFLPCFCTRWRWLHCRDHLEVCPAPNNRQGVHGAYCVMMILLLSWWNLVDSHCLATPQMLNGFGNFFHWG